MIVEFTANEIEKCRSGEKGFSHGVLQVLSAWPHVPQPSIKNGLKPSVDSSFNSSQTFMSLAAVLLRMNNHSA